MRVPTSRVAALLMIAVAAIHLGGCGEDEPPAEPTTKPAANKKPNNPQKGAGGKSAELFTYVKIEDKVAEDEAAAIRHRFVVGDFAPDPTGGERRDPFRSYVVDAPGLSGSVEAAPIRGTEVCTAENMVASNYSLRDLQLAGIVLRGTRSYAMFTDTANFGHILRRGDCLGKEKARVAVIGDGFVKLELVPDPAPGQPSDGATTEITRQLHPEELGLDEAIADPPSEPAEPAAPTPAGP